MTPQEMADTHAAAFVTARAWTADEFADLRTNRFTHILGDPRCFAVFTVIADEAELLTIATHPRFQRQGLARHCMTQWQARAAKLGATRAFLEVAADNSAAFALYAASGYRECGVRKDYYLRDHGPKIDAILMENQLI